MQPLRQRIIDSTGAHPLRADTPVQARAPTHAPLAATSESRIHIAPPPSQPFKTRPPPHPHTRPIPELDEHAETHTPTILSDHHLNAAERTYGTWTRETVWRNSQRDNSRRRDRL